LKKFSPGPSVVPAP